MAWFGFTSIGFSGSRHLAGAHAYALQALAASAGAAGVTVLVGCAPGADAAVRSAIPAARVFAVRSGRWGDGPGAYAARSSALVRELAQLPSPLLVSVPGTSCPLGIIPASSWRSGTPCSGSWSTAALAAGLGIPIVLIGSQVPATWGSGSPGNLAGIDIVWFRPLSQLSLF